MRFGIFGAAQAGSPRPATPMGQGFHDFIDFNVEAEALGYHSTFLVEHHFTGWNQVSATLTLLTWLAARTTALRLGTAVMVLPWHNPVLLAEQAATLDLLSKGRLDFGVGKGYRYNEFTGFAIPLDEADARFEEALAIITKAWTSGQRFSHHGPSGPSTTSWSSRRPGKNRTRRSGWPPGPPRRFAVWPSVATICSSTSSQRSTSSASALPYSRPSAPRAGVPTIQWGLPLRATCMSPTTRPPRTPPSNAIASSMNAFWRWRVGRIAPSDRIS